MNSHPPRPAAFTLVELLTVIAIIAILMGLLFPAISIVKEQARKAEAKTACAGIVAAVKAYNTEYGKFPVLDNKPTADLFFGDTGAGAAKHNDELFNVLRAKIKPNTTPDYNPRRVVFFEGKDASSKDTPKGGFKPATAGGDAGPFFDPWGGEYNVIMDADYDNKVDVSKLYTDFNNALDTSCVAFSLGKDGQSGTKGDKKYKSATGTLSDDVISWQ